MKDNRQEKTPLVDALKRHRQESPAYFCIPGHRYERGVSRRWLDEEERAFLAYDLTEVDGLDDLHQPSGVIRESQELLAELYHSKKSYFLINGTTCGNEAMLLGTLKEGDKVLLPRNVHKSILEGLILSGAVPVYFMPEWMEEEGMFGGIDPARVERAFQENPECKALFLVNPTYYGLSSDLEKIAAICHRYGAFLLVDEAHGGHFYFSEELPMGALQAGADMCAQSFHKITAALTQSSVLHIGSERIDRTQVERALRLVQSTSPSYLLMASLDAARYELANHGGERIRRALSLADTARHEINQILGVHCFTESELTGRAHICATDRLRLVFRCEGVGGYELQEFLRHTCGIDTELADFKNVLAIVTSANTEKEMQKLIEGLQWAAEHYNRRETTRSGGLPVTLAPVVLTPREAYFAESKVVPWEQAKDEVLAELIAPYPPGIPLVCPGERLTEELWEQVEVYRREGCHIHGPEDEKLQFVKIIQNEFIKQ